MLLKLVLDFGPIVHVKLFFKAGPSKNVQLIELGLNPQTLVVGPFYLIHVTFVLLCQKHCIFYKLKSGRVEAKLVEKLFKPIREQHFCIVGQSGFYV